MRIYIIILMLTGVYALSISFYLVSNFLLDAKPIGNFVFSLSIKKLILTIRFQSNAFN